MTPTPTSSGAPEVLPHPKRSILRSVVWQSLLVSSFTILLLSVLSFVLARSLTAEQRLFEQLAVIVTERRNALEDAMHEARRVTAIASKDIDGTGPRTFSETELNEVLEDLNNSSTAMRAVGISLFDDERTRFASAGELSPGYFYPQPGTFLVPSIDPKTGFSALAAYSPLKDEEGKIWGTLSVQFDTAPLLQRIFADLTQSVGRTAEVIVAREQGGEIFVVHHSQNAQVLKSYPLGVLDEEFIQDSPIAKAVMGEEGSVMAKDDRGRKVLVSYRYAETLGWAMLVQVESEEALAGVTMLAFSLIAISVLLLALAGMVGFFFARRLTEPLLHLVGKIRVLRPGHWTFRLSIRTGDEVEMLDQVIADLTSRLQATYERLEGQVADKTQALQKQITLDRAILEGIEYGVLTTDAAGVITDGNEAASRLLGFNREELVTKTATEMMKIHHQKGMVSNESHPVTVTLRDKTTFRAPPSMHLTIIRKDQTLLPVMLMVTPLMQETALLGSIIIFLDVTEERQTDYMKSEFISLASHQLRTPLSSLRWYLELLTGDTDVKLTDEQKEYLSEVQKASSQMASLLDTLLRVARLDEGGVMMERKNVDVIDLLERLFDEIRQGNHDKKLGFISTLPKQPMMMDTDPVLLPIVVQNLVTNAMKYSPQGGNITLGISEDATSVHITVADQGVGIPPEEQARVFEKFFRAKNIRHMLTSGTGLGLYLSKRIMDTLGGHLTFVSEQGKGTTFTATIPKQ